MALHNDVFKQQIWGFFCNDIYSCLEVSKIVQGGEKSPFSGGLNFTTTLAIFSVIELATGYWTGRDPNHDSISDFLIHFFSKYDSRFKNKNVAKRFYDVFRNGMSHQWSPKASGISMDFNGDWIIEKIEGNKEKILALNVPQFFHLTKNVLNDFEKELDSNKDLRDLFEKRYSNLVKSDFESMRRLRSIL